MKPNSMRIKTFTLILLLLGFSYSTAFCQKISKFNSPWELQAHLKHLNEYKLYSDLKTFLENNYSNSSLNLETRLYILDDLANLYATKLIDFKKADEFNKKAQDLYTSLSSRDFKELAFSNYFNENRLISDLFYFTIGGVLI